MYVRHVKRTVPMGTLPQGYSGSLTVESTANVDDKARESGGHYKFTKCDKSKQSEHIKPSLFDDDSGCELLLLGILIFLYVGCEHNKENLILIGVIAYLLFGTDDHTGSDSL